MYSNMYINTDTRRGNRAEKLPKIFLIQIIQLSVQT